MSSVRRGPPSGLSFPSSSPSSLSSGPSDGAAFLLSSPGAAAVDAYLEYDRIVGSADGGKLFSPAEYEEFKERMGRERSLHRLFVTWRNSQTGMDCRAVGPSSLCFCGHRFKEHRTDNWQKKDVSCKAAGCKCPLFDFLNVRGSGDVRCSGCKHSFSEHSAAASHRCLLASSSSSGRCVCPSFRTSNSCSCGSPWALHRTVFESKEERKAANRETENLAPGAEAYEALGGITSFLSLADGVDVYRMVNGEEAPMPVADPKTGQMRHPKWAEKKRIEVSSSPFSSALAPSSANSQKRISSQEVRAALSDPSAAFPSSSSSAFSSPFPEPEEEPLDPVLARKVADLRRGKISEEDEMALYARNFPKSNVSRPRKALPRDPFTPSSPSALPSSAFPSSQPSECPFSSSSSPLSPDPFAVRRQTANIRAAAVAKARGTAASTRPW